MRSKRLRCRKRGKLRGRMRIFQLQTSKVLLLQLILVSPANQTQNTSTKRYNSKMNSQDSPTALLADLVDLANSKRSDLQKLPLRGSDLGPETSTFLFNDREANTTNPTNEVSLSVTDTGTSHFEFLHKDTWASKKNNRSHAGTGSTRLSLRPGCEDNTTSIRLGLSTNTSDQNVSRKNTRCALFSDKINNFACELNFTAMQNESAPRNVNSCQGRCGEDTNFPCSCEEKCVVHKNCCEDLADACPELFHFALSKFQHLILASVSCDPALVVFLVDSCPPTALENVATSRQDQTFSENTPSMILSKQISKIDKPWKISSITEALSEAPVTDYSTGIVFANFSIYECNMQISQGNSSQEIDGKWLIQIGLKNNTIPKTATKIQQELDLKSCSFIPPKTQPESAGAMCHNNWTISCISTLSDKLGLQNVVCNTSVSEYYKIRKQLFSMFWTDRLLAQYICDSCFLDYQISSHRENRNPYVGFKLLAQLSTTPGHVSLIIEDQHFFRRFPMISWHSLNCSLPGVLTESKIKNTSCQLSQCGYYFLLTPDKLCRKTVDFSFSIQKEFVFEDQSCRINPERLFIAVTCYLRVFHKLRTTSKLGEISQVFHAKRHIDMIVIKIEMYFEVEDFEAEHYHLHYMREPFLAAILGFTKHYCLRVLGLEKEKSTRVQNSSVAPLSQQLKVDTVKSSRSKIISDHVVFEYCLSYYPHSTPSQCTFTSTIRFHIPNTSKRLGMIRKAESLKCLIDENIPQTSKSKKLESCVSTVFIYLSFTLTFFVTFSGSLICDIDKSMN